MGMAASQARYLALVARKSNCEYEGQQINQSRLNLSNKSANLFNQMMGLNVPVPPSKQDYMKLQYTYTDGTNEFAITKWHQLANADSDGYNYIVTRYYETEEYVGSQKLKNNPQVQFKGVGPSPSTEYETQIATIEAAQKAVASAQNDYDTAVANYKSLVAKSGSLEAYSDSTTVTNIKSKTTYSSGTESGYTITRQEINKDGYQIFKFNGENRYQKNGKYYTYDSATEQYTEVKDEDPTQYEEALETRNYISYNTLSSDTDKKTVSDAIDTLKAQGALTSDFKYADTFYDKEHNSFAFLSDMSAVPGTSKILPQYYPNTPPEGKTGIAETKQAIQAAETQMEISKSALEVAEATLKALDLPTYVGNNPLTPLSTLSDNQVTEIGQIIKDMRANNINTNLIRCFNTLSGNYDANTYLGGIYTYEVNNTIYYTTYYDLANSYVNGEGINNIDNQAKLPVYTADYVPTRKEITEKALLEVNNEGRFTTARFENDSVVYKLNAEEIEDTVGYEDAMNQYDYDKAKYDKKVAEINAQTSLIQREDQDLELRLKQLDTEQNALNTEIDAVSKVVKDNVEKSFKTFSG